MTSASNWEYEPQPSSQWFSCSCEVRVDISSSAYHELHLNEGGPASKYPEVIPLSSGTSDQAHEETSSVQAVDWLLDGSNQCNGTDFYKIKPKQINE